MANEIATRADIAQLTELIQSLIKQNQQIASNNPSSNEEFLRTRHVLKMLNVSPNKLSDMRLKGQIPWKQIGDTFFYPKKALLDTMRAKTHQANTEV